MAATASGAKGSRAALNVHDEIFDCRLRDSELTCMLLKIRDANWLMMRRVPGQLDDHSLDDVSLPSRRSAISSGC
jgi:hypothetical protein